MTVAPFGSWVSPIAPADLAGAAHDVAGGRFVGEQVWWLELRPAEGGRYAVRRAGADGQPEDVLPPPWNARTRVHEYGGGAWTASPDGLLVFAEFADQRLYRLDEPGGTPVPLTPEPPTTGAWRYGELSFGRVGEIWCIRERHGEHGRVERDIAAIPVDGSAADDVEAIRSVAGGSHFLTAPRISPDGRRLAWIAWEHPQMPWDGTELRVADLDADGVAGGPRTLLGSTTESVLQPEWLDADTLLVLTDCTGFWNLHRIAASGGEPTVLAPAESDLGGPLWQLGMSWYRLLDGGRALIARRFGTDTLGILDLATEQVTELDLGGHSSVSLGPVRGSEVLITTKGARTPGGLRLLDLDSGALTTLRADAEPVADAAYFADARAMTFHGPSGREVHTVVYPPQNPDFAAPAGELAPYVAFVHGGPTSVAVPRMATQIAFLTSRGLGVVDVNYGGSTGYGREYRERLRGQWGVVDVEDTIAAVQGLAEAGLADPARLAIVGGSAGGWTVLAALTTSDVFACGASYFGVAELVKFAQDTHDFESRYLDGLIGPLPETLALYESRAPVNNVDGLSCPVLLLQGLDDPVVPPSQAEMFRDALRRKGIPHAYREYAGESHGFRRSETIIDAAESELSFYGQVLGFDPPGVPALELWRP